MKELILAAPSVTTSTHNQLIWGYMKEPTLEKSDSHVSRHVTSLLLQHINLRKHMLKCLDQRGSFPGLFFQKSRLNHITEIYKKNFQIWSKTLVEYLSFIIFNSSRFITFFVLFECDVAERNKRFPARQINEFSPKSKRTNNPNQ